MRIVYDDEDIRDWIFTVRAARMEKLRVFRDRLLQEAAFIEGQIRDMEAGSGG